MEKERCPYCGKEMENVYLYAFQTADIYILSEEQSMGKKRLFLLYLIKRARALRGINKRYGLAWGWRNPRVPAKQCKNCDKIIVHYVERMK